MELNITLSKYVNIYSPFVQTLSSSSAIITYTHIKY
jgi:hypothetical protein